ncbi:MAG: zinc ribbon domain-containing protein [Candidatus Heimdallarchaeota archaeon]|nr:zinc ribbon domain-containing protein [Candidatus Heimdallarchaeota archaeon]MDH5646440.1 zinc ribbon domain-containing protein [Candidatus Heimdallarchaeota archaeon]
MSENPRSKLDIITIILTVIGVLVVINDQQIGLTLIFVAGLLWTAGIVLRRLEKIGAEMFAFGSILVWVGYLLFALPILGFAWNLFKDSNTEIILFIAGIILILLGYTTEYYDLNIRFVEFLRKTKIKFDLAWRRISRSILKSPWILIAFIVSIYLLMTLTLPEFLYPLQLIVPGKKLSFYYLIIVCFIITPLSIEFKDFIFAGIETLVGIFSIIFQWLFWRIKSIPQLFVSLIKLIKEFFAHMISFISSIFYLFIQRKYIISFFGSLVFVFYGLLHGDMILLYFTSFFLILTITYFISENTEVVSDRINSIHQRTYQRSLFVRNRFKKKDLICPKCKQIFPEQNRFCIKCGFEISKCMVCKGKIIALETIIQCNNCDAPAHEDHILKWIMIKNICPNCREQWN